jgi:hypothetical protein
MGSEIDSGQPRGTIFSMKPAPWQWVLVGLMILGFYTVGIFVEYDSLTHDPIISRSRFGVETQVTGTARWLLIAVTSVLYFVVPWVAPIAMFLVPGFAIREDGLILNRQDRRDRVTPWEEVHFCQWDHYQRGGRLTIQIPHERVSISIPKRHRDKVEAELRRFGKWRD